MKMKIKRDGMKCEIEMKETSKGIKMKTKGKQCKKLMGKEYFKETEIEMGDWD